jgi:hypothetical protein
VGEPDSAREIGVVLAARAKTGGMDAARAFATAGEESHPGEPGLRARRYGPLLRAARAEKRAAEVLAELPRPMPLDRYAFVTTPLLYEIALTHLDAGNAEDAALACAELVAAAPTWAPGHYCVGRAAEAQKDWRAAFAGYRAFLDRWVDADEEHAIMRDARRRLARVIAAARAP